MKTFPEGVKFQLDRAPRGLNTIVQKDHCGAALEPSFGRQMNQASWLQQIKAKTALFWKTL